jgi:hypothetical protein
MTRKLKQSVRNQFESYALNDDQLRNLESLGKQIKTRRTGPVSIYRWSLVGTVAAFILAFLLTPLILDQGDIHERVALEVATNHLKLKPLEIETASIDRIREYFDKLDFMPVKSTLINELGLELAGGRYCSLQGIAAAQLRVRQPGSDRVQTLYQTEYRKDVFKDMPVLEQGDTPIEVYAKGIRVKIWSEKGLVFALTDLPQ